MLQGPGLPGRLAVVARAAAFAVRLLSQTAAGIAGLACLGSFALICYGVAARYFWGRPQPWSDEAVVWLIMASVLLAAPEAQRRNEHIGVDAILEKATGRLRSCLLLLGFAAVAATAFILLLEGMKMVAFTRMLGLRPLVNPEVPLWIVQALVPAGAFLMLAVVAAQILARVAGVDGERARPQARAVE